MALSGRIWPRLASEMRRVLPLAAARDLSSAQKFLDVAVNEKTGVSTVTMQRPPVNSLNLELLQELARTLDRLRSDNSRGMILTSASQTIFSAGLDLFEMYKPDQERVRAFWTVLQDMWLSLYTTPFPTVAVINGHSPAGGCLLAMSCEYRIMLGPRFTIGLNETQLGLVAPKCAAQGSGTGAHDRPPLHHGGGAPVGTRRRGGLGQGGRHRASGGVPCSCVQDTRDGALPHQADVPAGPGQLAAREPPAGPGGVPARRGAPGRAEDLGRVHRVPQEEVAAGGSTRLVGGLADVQP
ncbi:enoyl-CoA delta isomerase 1, mitochondrial-like isoform X1 [Bacillus rossius redtenbacheri]|uniref:enoyl-CoA delta isomerase 1, mitochondrial-like isoform X1 n=1 Tax=Bacillus rossius redtenbacheri TaxID=93214 RepID=UPI002FDC9C70